MSHYNPNNPHLSPVLVRDGEDPHDGVAILLDEVVDVPREHRLSDHGNLQTLGHGASNVLITRRGQFNNQTGHTLYLSSTEYTGVAVTGII